MRLRTAAALAGAAAFPFLTRPWYVHWGAGPGEANRILPGDELVPGARFTSTRAVTIEAPPAAVWPWLAQMGQGRGGLYSYDWLENLFGCHIHNAEHIVAEWQHVKPGDHVRLVPPSRGEQYALEIAVVEPPSVLVLRTPGPAEPAWAGLVASWAFIVLPVEHGRSRLFARWRADHRGAAGWLWVQALLPPVHFVMERKMLLGIKARAERTHWDGIAAHLTAA